MTAKPFTTPLYLPAAPAMHIRETFEASVPTAHYRQTAAIRTDTS